MGRVWQRLSLRMLAVSPVHLLARFVITCNFFDTTLATNILCVLPSLPSHKYLVLIKVYTLQQIHALMMELEYCLRCHQCILATKKLLL